MLCGDERDASSHDGKGHVNQRQMSVWWSCHLGEDCADQSDSSDSTTCVAEWAETAATRSRNHMQMCLFVMHRLAHSVTGSAAQHSWSELFAFFSSPSLRCRLSPLLSLSLSAAGVKSSKTGRSTCTTTVRHRVHWPAASRTPAASPLVWVSAQWSALCLWHWPMCIGPRWHSTLTRFHPPAGQWSRQHHVWVQGVAERGRSEAGCRPLLSRRFNEALVLFLTAFGLDRHDPYPRLHRRLLHLADGQLQDHGCAAAGDLTASGKVPWPVWAPFSPDGDTVVP